MLLPRMRLVAGEVSGLPLRRFSRPELQAAIPRLVSPVIGNAFLDEGPHGFGVLRRTRRNDHLLGLLIQ